MKKAVDTTAMECKLWATQEYFEKLTVLDWLCSGTPSMSR